jgi:hypothetical protein
MPAVEDVAVRAKEILASIKADKEFPAFVVATLRYDADWTCFSGTPIISRYDQDTDKAPLLEEGLRALALKAAVYEMTGDEKLSEVPVAIPVDEMTHAMIAQPQLLDRITDRVGVHVIHQTDQEHTDWRQGDYTHQAYTVAWGEPPERYWVGHEEAQRRLAILKEKYEQAGFLNMGLSHVIDFAVAA